MSRVGKAVPRAEKAEPIVEAGRDLVEGERLRARGRELDRKWKTVELAADPRHGHRTWPVHRKISARSASAREEQPDRCELLDLVGRYVVARRQQGLDRVIDLTRDTERNSARCQHSNVAARAEHVVCELATSPRKMLAVVEYEQQLLAAEVVEESVEGGDLRPFGNAERLRDGGRHARSRHVQAVMSTSQTPPAQAPT